MITPNVEDYFGINIGLRRRKCGDGQQREEISRSPFFISVLECEASDLRGAFGDLRQTEDSGWWSGVSPWVVGVPVWWWWLSQAWYETGEPLTEGGGRGDWKCWPGRTICVSSHRGLYSFVDIDASNILNGDRTVRGES